jgi:hypothetical protein
LTFVTTGFYDQIWVESNVNKATAGGGGEQEENAEVVLVFYPAGGRVV